MFSFLVRGVTPSWAFWHFTVAEHTVLFLGAVLHACASKVG